MAFDIEEYKKNSAELQRASLFDVTFSNWSVSDHERELLKKLTKTFNMDSTSYVLSPETSVDVVIEIFDEQSGEVYNTLKRLFDKQTTVELICQKYKSDGAPSYKIEYRGIISSFAQSISWEDQKKISLWTVQFTSRG